MATITEAKQSIYNTFIAGWGTTTPIILDGENADPPPSLPYVQIMVRHFTGVQDTLGGVGNRKFKRDGAIMVQIYGPLDEGSQTTDNLAITAIGILEGKTLADNVFTFASTPTEIGPTDDGYLTTVTTPFFYRETK